MAQAAKRRKLESESLETAENPGDLVEVRNDEAIVVNEDEGGPVFPVLPPEMWTHIFASLDDLDSLKTCRQVSRLWNNLVVPVLTKRVIVSIRIYGAFEGSYKLYNAVAQKYSVDQFVKDALTSQARPDLAHPIKYLDLTFDATSDFTLCKSPILEIQKLLSFTTVLSARFIRFPLASWHDPLECLQAPLRTLETLEVDHCYIEEKANLNVLFDFAKSLPVLREFECTLVFANESPVFNTRAWDADIIDGFAQLTHLKALDLIFKRKFRDFDIDNSRAVVERKMSSLGQAIAKALQAHQVQVTCTNRIKYLDVDNLGDEDSDDIWGYSDDDWDDYSGGFDDYDDEEDQWDDDWRDELDYGDDNSWDAVDGGEDEFAYDDEDNEEENEVGGEEDWDNEGEEPDYGEDVCDEQDQGEDDAEAAVVNGVVDLDEEVDDDDIDHEEALWDAEERDEDDEGEDCYRSDDGEEEWHDAYENLDDESNDRWSDEEDHEDDDRYHWDDEEDPWGEEDEGNDWDEEDDL